MTEPVFETILEQMNDFKSNLKSVALFLDGEPLIDRFLEHRITRCKSKDIPHLGFTTNGSLFNPERIQNILDAEPDWIVFSLDSMQKESYEKIRVRLKFERVQKKCS
jgi:wyosine [tRNA(Phe)-imidazoG37] synthetase (radical SAM superfamily)